MTPATQSSSQIQTTIFLNSTKSSKQSIPQVPSRHTSKSYNSITPVQQIPQKLLQTYLLAQRAILQTAETIVEVVEVAEAASPASEK